MAPIRLAHVPHSKSTSTIPSRKASLLVRLFKSLLTLYLLLAIFYTFYHLLLSPVYRYFLYGAGGFGPGGAAGRAGGAGRGGAGAGVAEELALSQGVSSARLAALGFPPEIPVRPLPDGSTGLDAAKGPSRGPGKKPLKGAAVNSEEVRAEDAGSLWGKKKGAHAVVAPSGSGWRYSQTADGAIIPPRAAVDGFDPSLSLLSWHAPAHHLSLPAISTPHKLELPPSVRKVGQATPEDSFISKAFGESLGPSKVVPFHYKATGPKRKDGSQSDGPEKEDITIATLVTPNRFKVFEKLVEHYQGPVSATVHVSNNPETLKQTLDSLDEMYQASPYMPIWVDIHLVVDPFDRQFNMWRNVAKFFARTEYVMMLDVDFWLCTSFRSRILSSPNIMSLLRAGTAAFVVPAFEFSKQSDGVDPTTFPKDKQALIKTVKEGRIGMFHKSWQPGHGATNYTRYYEAKPGEVYRAQAYTHSYEPYVIFKKEGTPFCDERFIGYGGNKAACLFELYLSGVSYYVLPDDFVIHQSHAYAEQARKHERRYNRKLYADFREETCFRYLNQMIEAGELETPKAKNMMTECKKIKGFGAAAGRLASAYYPASANSAD